VSGLSSTDTLWHAILVVVTIPAAFVAAERVLPAEEVDQKIVDWEDNDTVADHDRYNAIHSHDESSASSITAPDTTPFEDIPSDNDTHSESTGESSLDNDPPIEKLVPLSEGGQHPDKSQDVVDDSRIMAESLSTGDHPSTVSQETAQWQGVSTDSEILSTIPQIGLEMEESSLPPTTVILNSGETNIDDLSGPSTHGEGPSNDPAIGDELGTGHSNGNRIQDYGNGSVLDDTGESLVIDEPDPKTKAEDTTDAQPFDSPTDYIIDDDVGNFIDEDGNQHEKASLAVPEAQDDFSDENIEIQRFKPDDVAIHSLNETDLTEMAIGTMTPTDDLPVTTRSNELSPVDLKGINTETTESSKGGLTLAPEEALAPVANKMAPPEESLESADHEMSADVHLSYFENIPSQQAQMNAIQEGEADQHSPILSITDGSYSGLPWGILHVTSRRLPDMELLYQYFKDRMNAEANFYDRPQPKARFPLSMGDNGQQSDEGDVTNDSSGDQELIDHLVHLSDQVVYKMMGSSEKNPRNSSDLSSEDQERILQSIEEEDADGLRELFQGVDPPDELDVGAASGSSMQEFLMGKSKEILFRRVSLGIKLFQRLLVTTKRKLKERFGKRTEKAEVTSDRHRREDRRQSEDTPASIALLIDRNWKQTANSLWKVSQTAFQYVVRVFDNLMEGDEDAGNNMIDTLGENMDLDVIRKMSGLNQ
jgi:hypothetical protein